MARTLKIARTLIGVLVVLAVLAAGISQAATASKAKAKPQVKITAAQATKVALKKYPGKVVGKVPLEDEEGSWQYAVSIRSGKVLREIMVDANTGKIANVEVTNDAKEAAESKAEAAKGKKGEAGEKGEANEKD